MSSEGTKSRRKKGKRAKEDHGRILFADKGVYQRVGEATELALRVLTEKIGLLGYASHALDGLSRTDRATYCNDHWQQSYKKVNPDLRRP